MSYLLSTHVMKIPSSLQYSLSFRVKGVSGAVDTGHGSGSQVMESAHSQAARTQPEPEPGVGAGVSFHLA